MALNSRSRGILNVGKRFFNQVRVGATRDPTQPPSLTLCRRGVHVSVYDKNPDDHHPAIVPDNVIHPQSDKYWAPHPQTGVFGPAADHNPAKGFHSLPANRGQDSVLEQKAFFRPLEDLEKPPHP